MGDNSALEHVAGGMGLGELAGVAAIAVLFGMALLRLRQPAILGFILAGVVAGPSMLALVENTEGVQLFAELGVLLLLFVIGAEMSLRSLRKVMRVVFLCAVLQMLAAMSITALIGWLADWPAGRIVLVGFVLSLSSTAVAIKLLESVGEARRESGRVTVGVLVSQDLLVIPMLIVIASFGARGGGIDALVALKIAAAVIFMALLVLTLSRRDRIRIPFADRLAHDADAAPLAAIAFCLVLATITNVIGLSAAYGAFMAGLILSATSVRRQLLQVAVPIQSILMLAFFLSIGLMIDIGFILGRLPMLLLLLLLVLAGKTVVNLIALRVLNVAPRDAVIASVAMAQLGEFGFVLAATALGAGAIGPEGYQISLAVIALSLLASPFWMMTADRVMKCETEAATVKALLAEAFAPERDRASAYLRRMRARFAPHAGAGAAGAEEQPPADQ